MAAYCERGEGLTTMAATVVPSAATAETFEGAFERAVLQSERLRVTIVIVGILFTVVRGIVLWVLLPETTQSQLGGSLNVATLGVIGVCALAYEVAVLIRLTVLWRRRGHLPRVVRFVSAFVEVSIPTLAMVYGPEVTSPVYVLFTPPSWVYFLFIILSTLRLDFTLCVFTGAVAAIQYGMLGLYVLSQPQNGAIDPLLLATVNHSTRVILLMASGIVAGIVSQQIRRQFQRALRSMAEQNRILGMFGQHVSPAVVDRLLSQDVELGGEVRHVCMMFLDIEGFTTFSESRRPEEVVEYLNSLFSFMIESVNRHHGIVNKFLGDGFMAVFGAPISDARDSRNAVAASLEIMRTVEAMSASGEIAPTRIRIGLHAGDAVTGNVGSSARKEYTIIGDVVNLASRLEQLNKQFGSRVLISETVAERLDGEQDRMTPHGAIQVKGREQPVHVYELA
jgi:adenylate cyclase